MKKRKGTAAKAKREDAPAAPAARAEKKPSQQFTEDMEEAAPFAYAFVKAQNRSLWRSHAKYKRQATSEKARREALEADLGARAQCAISFDTHWASLEIDLAQTLEALGGD
eukprot:CAMPEP_0119264940 /NCGR_PEP_ID=MMETSP1329-20130426/3887_1 /TAXON_ID=114041 /ORGANISM="Genus nov. species nov., Strain RCC1024" /LENGTH=110 /DNA_ID=CAMNT_0007264733 /DNA_START=134 /DNA_END=463 /DNA_ORIENTATION=+